MGRYAMLLRECRGIESTGYHLGYCFVYMRLLGRLERRPRGEDDTSWALRGRRACLISRFNVSSSTLSVCSSTMTAVEVLTS